MVPQNRYKNYANDCFDLVTQSITQSITQIVSQTDTKLVLWGNYLYFKIFKTIGSISVKAVSNSYHSKQSAPIVRSSHTLFLNTLLKKLQGGLTND